MRLATIRHDDETTQAVRLDLDGAIALPASDLGALFENPDWRAVAEQVSGTNAIQDYKLSAPIARPGKIVCVGLNYREHILEMGRPLPEFPTLFAKFADALVGPYDDVVLPPESDAMDWEGELAVVIGSTVRRASPSDASAAIAGYTILNDVTARDFQYRTTQWLQGKTFEATTPVGPCVVTPDEFDPASMITTLVDGEEVQRASVADLVFDTTSLVAYISTVITLGPGDIVATGTPGGVGHGMKPARYLGEGTVLTTRIDGIGELVNRCRRDASKLGQ